MKALGILDENYQPGDEHYGIPHPGIFILDTNMQIVHLRDITQDYARTLADWRERFMGAEDEVRVQGFDDDFMRLWEFYLCYCEGGFRERIISTVQLSFAKPEYRFPA